MSTDLVPVPQAARDANLTPTERFEIIARAQPGMSTYTAPRETGEVTTRAGSKVPTAVMYHAHYLARCRDEKGLVSTEQYVSGGGCSLETSAKFTYGYQLPAGAKFDPQELMNMLFIAKQAKIPANHVFNFMVEFSKYLS